MSPPLQHRVALDTGMALHVLEWGEAHSAPHTILLLHGFLDTAWTWEEVAPRLAQHFHVVAPDMRGYGDSDRVGAGGYYHPPDYVADVAALVDARARGALSIVGHSMGGSIAAYYTGSFPQRVTRLALLEGLGPPESTPTSPERMVAWIAACRSARARTARRYANLEAAAERMRASDERLSPERALRLADQGTHRAADGSRSFKHDPLHATPGPNGFSVATASRFWSAIACPCLIVDGEESPMRHAAEEAARRRAFIRGHRHTTLTGAGHMMQWHQPEALSALLIDFLTAPEGSIEVDK